MQSTASRAGWPAASIAARSAGMSLRTDEAVSVCTVSTARIRPSRSARSRASTRAGSRGARKPKSSSSTSMFMRAAISAQPTPKRPVAIVSAVSPGASRLARAASQAAWPLPM